MARKVASANLSDIRVSVDGEFGYFFFLSITGVQRERGWK